MRTRGLVPLGNDSVQVTGFDRRVPAQSAARSAGSPRPRFPVRAVRACSSDQGVASGGSRDGRGSAGRGSSACSTGRRTARRRDRRGGRGSRPGSVEPGPPAGLPPGRSRRGPRPRRSGPTETRPAGYLQLSHSPPCGQHSRRAPDKPLPASVSLPAGNTPGLPPGRVARQDRKAIRC